MVNLVISQDAPMLGDLIKLKSIMDPNVHFYGVITGIEKCDNKAYCADVFWVEDGHETLFLNLNDIEIIA